MRPYPTFAKLNALRKFYQIGLLNTIFGYGLYAGMIKIGANPYLAQIIAHLIGMAFNYYTYSRHVFTNSQANKYRFVASYGVNYLASFAILALVLTLISNRYLAGLATLITTSIINYFILSRLVFLQNPSISQIDEPVTGSA